MSDVQFTCVKVALPPVRAAKLPFRILLPMKMQRVRLQAPLTWGAGVVHNVAVRPINGQRPEVAKNVPKSQQFVSFPSLFR
jgi:hypothetical protein